MLVTTPKGEKVYIELWVTNPLIQRTKGRANFHVRTSNGIKVGFDTEEKARKYFKKLLAELKGDIENVDC